jgi:predicted transcriptional regulator
MDGRVTAHTGKAGAVLMKGCPMSELSLQLPDDVLTRLQSEAERRQVPLDDLVRVAIESYLDQDEPTRDAILESLRQAMRDALAGRVRPARAVLDELRREIENDADNG